MKIRNLVEEQIFKIEPGKIFTYKDLNAYFSNPATTLKVVGFLLKRKEIKRFIPGKFYRPKKGVFGELNLSDAEKIRSFTYFNGELQGYVTGMALYNRLGLTTQVPKTIIIASNKTSKIKNFDTINIKLIKARCIVSESNREYLEILDFISDVNKIPDARLIDVIEIIVKKIKNNEENLYQLVNLSLSYSRLTQKRLKMLLEEINPKNI